MGARGSCDRAERDGRVPEQSGRKDAAARIVALCEVSEVRQGEAGGHAGDQWKKSTSTWGQPRVLEVEFHRRGSLASGVGARVR